MNRLAIRFVFALSIIAATAAVPAGAMGIFSLSGDVTDALGNPLPQVRIDIGSQVQFTDIAGHYSFEVFSPGTYKVDYVRNDLISVKESVDLNIQDPNVVRDETMKYWFTSTPYSVDAYSPQAIAINARTFSPRGFCVSVGPNNSEAPMPMSFLREDEFGMNYYSGTYDIPADATPGSHTLVIKAVNCSTGASGGLGYAAYRLVVPPPPDLTGPSINIVAPGEGRITFESFDVAASLDGSTQVLIDIDFMVDIADPGGMGRVRFELYRGAEGKELVWYCDPGYSGAGRYSCSGLLFTGNSRWEFRVTALDKAGNTSTASRLFEANGGPLERDRLVEL